MGKWFIKVVASEPVSVFIKEIQEFIVWFVSLYSLCTVAWLLWDTAQKL